MADKSDSSLIFFQKATSGQWLYMLSKYKDVLKVKAQQTRGSRKGGPQELIKIDTWYQEQLPKIINSRKERHISHEELVQIMKWKLMRGKYRPRLIDLVKINTELAVLQASKKAFKKLPNLSGAIVALTNLKGIGPASASAVLAAAAPEHAPFMADECMLATPGVEATDYTLAEYLNYSEQIQNCCERLKAEDPDAKWTPHKLELALWTHYLGRQMYPSMFDQMPLADGTIPKITSSSDDCSNGVNDDSNPSVLNSEVDDKSNDSSFQDNSKDGKDGFRHPGNGAVAEDSLGLISSEENSRNVISEDNENSNSNLSGDFVTSGGDTNTNDSTAAVDEPSRKKIRAE
ncbi:uncharacterized protein B4U80_04609 [Leptotrombidium deliense]|uniref:Uncharacterized protein n=1 Tax=Leptotrombidium deliense TaxID=299467 RepID=A0A443SVS2_9ACAR|nr:uncharacterized protein B4U80_04609 [Leptotrombidium deliense]